MAAVRLVSASPLGYDVTANTTRYLRLSTHGGGVGDTETAEQLIYRTPGVFSKLYVRARANTCNGTSTLTARINGANGTLTVPIGASTTGVFEDLTHTDTVAAGNTVVTGVVTAGSTGTVNLSVVAYTFAATSDTTCRVSDTPLFAATTATTYLGISGSGMSSTTEALTEYKLAAACDLKNLQVDAYLNTSTTQVTVVVRKNGGNTVVTLNIPALTTGAFEDTSNVASCVAGDLVTTAVSGVSSGKYILLAPVVDMLSTNNSFHFLAGQSPAIVSAGTTRYTAIGGGGSFSTTEADATAKLGVGTATLSKLRVYISTNGIAATSTVTTRKNTAAGGQSASITASTTGWFEDPSGSDSVVDTDTMSYRVVAGGSTSDVRFTALQMLATVSSAARTSTPMFIRQAVNRASTY